MSTGEKLRNAREKKGFTQQELAKRVSVSQSMIAQIERGTKAMSVELCKEVANAMECEVGELL